MHAIERLRHIARAGEIDASELAGEAAYALAGLASEPWTLVPACQRLLEFHPTCGPLWWVASHMLSAADVRAEAFRLVDALESDPTSEELAASFGAAAARVVADARWTILRAIESRPDLDVVLAGAPYDLRRAMRFLTDLVITPLGVSTDEVQAELEEMGTDGGARPTVVVEALAAGTEGVVLSAAAAEIARAARRRVSQPLDVVAPVGRLLPGALFGAFVRRTGATELDAGTENGERRPRHLDAGRPLETDFEPDRGASDAPVLVPIEALGYLVAPTGRRRAALALHKVTGPVPMELCRVR